MHSVPRPVRHAGSSARSVVGRQTVVRRPGRRAAEALLWSQRHGRTFGDVRADASARGATVREAESGLPSRFRIVELPVPSGCVPSRCWLLRSPPIALRAIELRPPKLTPSPSSSAALSRSSTPTGRSAIGSSHPPRPGATGFEHIDRLIARQRRCVVRLDRVVNGIIGGSGSNDACAAPINRQALPSASQILFFVAMASVSASVRVPTFVSVMLSASMRGRSPPTN